MDNNHTTLEDLKDLIESKIESNKVDRVIFRMMSAISGIVLIFILAYMIDSNGRTSRLESGKLDKAEASDFLRTTSYGTVENTRTKYFVNYVDKMGEYSGVPDTIRIELKTDVIENLNNTIIMATLRSGSPHIFK